MTGETGHGPTPDPLVSGGEAGSMSGASVSMGGAAGANRLTAAQRLAGGVKIDLRTKAGQQHKARIIEEATELREMGLTGKEIAGFLDVSPPWVSMYLPIRLQNLTHQELLDRQEAVKQGRDPGEYAAEQDGLRWEERRRRFRQKQEAKLETQRRRRQREARRNGRVTRSQEPPWLRTRVSLDMPGPEGEPLHAAIPDPRVTDPARLAEYAVLRELVGNLDLDDIDRMGEDALASLQERLRAAGFAPTGIQRRERDRLKRLVPLRGSAPPPKRQSMTTERKHRKPGHRSSAGGSRSSRKPPKRWSRERLVA